MRSKGERRRPAPKARPTSHVRRHIEHLILSGKVAGGERINENALATELDISRGPIREVTRQLAEVGLLTIIRNRGAFVRKVSLEDVLNIYDVRAGLARVAGRLAAIRATGAQIDDLRALWRKMGALDAKKAFADYYESNRKFHARIFAISNNAKLCDFEAATEREAYLYLRRGVVSQAHVGVSNKQHGEILKAIAARDETAAADAFENHIISGKHRMLDAMAGVS
jgi:DNA-binding GntR family transcriptional regulator